MLYVLFFFFQAEDGIRDFHVTGVQTCALPIWIAKVFTDLPSFVEHFRDPHFKLGLRGTVRMETPVLYFYSSKEETISVRSEERRVGKECSCLWCVHRIYKKNEIVE